MIPAGYYTQIYGGRNAGDESQSQSRESRALEEIGRTQDQNRRRNLGAQVTFSLLYGREGRSAMWRNNADDLCGPQKEG